MTLTAETLEKRLNNLANLASDKWTTAEWTKRVKKLLAELGEDMSYKVAVNGEGCTWGNGEWMCDVVWADLNEDELIRAIPLVAECEWGNKQDIWDDFQKLLIIHAGVRVMIFEPRSRDEAEELKQQIQCFDSSQEGDRYLFASYVHRESPPFSVEEYVLRRNS